jgi:hypothetical protein
MRKIGASKALEDKAERYKKEILSLKFGVCLTGRWRE